MIAIIDCGTTYTRIYLVDNNGSVVASGRKKVGVRDTSITGSRKALREGIQSLFEEVLADSGIDRSEIRFAASSGMITSEIGLMEISHLVAPTSKEDLAANIVEVQDPEVLDLGIPVLFIRGIKNDFDTSVGLPGIREVDFMRGEEVQCVGIAESGLLDLPLNIVVLSSHTKIIHIDQDKNICGSITTLSEQLYEAIVSATSVGKSLQVQEGESTGNYSEEEIIAIASDSVRNAGIVRTLMMPRFMDVLLQTSGEERVLFADAAIAADDIKAFDEFAALGFGSRNYILYGHENRCKLYETLLRQKWPGANIHSISAQDELGKMTIDGVLSILKAAGKR